MYKVVLCILEKDADVWANQYVENEDQDKQLADEDKGNLYVHV